MTDTMKWDKIWFRKLPPLYKCLWAYICDKCNFAGIWEVDFETAEYFIGEKIDVPLAQELFVKQFDVINGGVRWYIKDFIAFQYVNLTKNTVKKAVVNELKKYGVSIPHLSPIDGVKSQRQDNSNSKEVVKDVKDVVHIYKPDFDEVWGLYPRRIGRKQAERHFNSSVVTEKDVSDIKLAIQAYMESKPVKGGFVQHGSTWFNNWRDWVPESGLTDEQRRRINEITRSVGKS